MPNLVEPATDTPDPNLATLRNDSVDPRCAKFKADVVCPVLANDRKETADPTDEKLITESLRQEPAANSPMTDAELPSLAILRRETTDPK
jgi:hypothetical protein